MVGPDIKASSYVVDDIKREVNKHFWRLTGQLTGMPVLLVCIGHGEVDINLEGEVMERK